MKDIEIVYKSIKDLTPYANNPRKNDPAVDAVAESIRNFGWKVPIVIDSQGTIVTGHTRLKAAKKLKLKKVPCIIADDLSEEQIKAFRLADNKVSELADWDYDLLDSELEDLVDFNMEDFGFEFVNEAIEHETVKANTRNRVLNIHNLAIASYPGVGPYDIPEMAPVTKIPRVDEWIGFNYALSCKDPEHKGVHFFIDDYQFERVWNDPEKYVDLLRKFAVVATPDFSPYSDMPLATQIFNHYRKQWVGRFMQENGVTVIPTVRASADERSLDWYLDGIPKGGIVIISSMWTGHNADLMRYFKEKEYKIMYETLSPCKVYLYGKDMELPGDIEFIPSFTAKRF